MANVVNARDTQIMAASPRFLGITLNPNIIVDPDNVDGLGIIIAGTKQIWLASTTQVFQIPKTGATTPASVTLTANVRNLAATPTISLVSGTMSVTPALTGGVFTYTPAQQTSDTVTFRLTLVEGGLTYTDDLTIIKVREGSDAVTGLLTNENFSVPADYLGNVTSYSGCGGNFKVYQGATDVSSVCTFAIPTGGNPDSLTVGLTASGTGAGAYSITAGYPTATDITTVTFRATFGSTTIDKAMSIAKAKAGQTGVNATAYWLSRSASAVQKNLAGVYTPASVQFSGYSATGAGAPAAYACRFIIATTTDGSTYTNQFTSSADQTSKTYTVPAGIKAIRVRMYLAGGTTTLLDEEIIPVVVDGTGGVSAVLGNSAHVFPATNGGTVTSYVGSGTTLRVYSGSTELTYDGVGTTAGSWTVSSTATNITRGTLTDSGTYATIGDHSGVASGTDASSITYTVSGKDSSGVTFSFDVKQTFSKSKTGAAGSSGTSGVRGSRTFYVAIAGTSWSNATATTAASADGGPVLNDIVCEFNNAAAFSQTRFWDGSSWIVVNAVVDGNLLVSGTVGAKAMTINNGGGNNLWFDSIYYDVNAWEATFYGVLPIQAAITDGISGATSMKTASGATASARGAWRVPVTVGKQYRVSAKVRRNSAANGKLYIRLDTGTSRTGTYSDTVIGIEDISVTTTWAEYATTWTATAPYVSPMVLLNYAATAGVMEAQDIRIEELTDSALVVVGGISADRIDSRGLSIKDAAGNVILAAGSALDWAMVAGAGKPADNATVGATWGTNLTGIPYASILTNDDSVALGFNPTFEWPVGSTFPAGWSNWTGANPSRETSIVRVGTTSVKFTATGGNQGIVISSNFGTSPLPAGTFLSGSFDAYLQSRTSGTSGILVRLFTNAANTTYTDNLVTLPSTTTGVWQRVPWTARNGTSPLYGIQIFVMSGWTGFGTPLTGTVIFSNLRFMLADNSIDNKVITLNTNGTLAGAGGGAVTITGLGYSGDLNATNGATIGSNLGGQFNSGNISTFFASAAIGTAQIANAAITNALMGTAAVGLANIDVATITNLSSLSATIGTLRTASSGSRMEIRDNVLKVYEGTTLRVKLGNLAL